MSRSRDLRCAACAAFLALAVAACSAPATDRTQPPSGATGAITAHGLPELRNPLLGQPQAIQAGAALYQAQACPACHGRTLGGGMCPSLLNDVWVYGDDDSTLFHLVRDGSAGLRAHGYTRTGHEPQAGDMPPFGGSLDDTQIWQLLAYLRAQHPAR